MRRGWLCTICTGSGRGQFKVLFRHCGGSEEKSRNPQTG